MRAAFYDRTGPAGDVLQIGDVPTPHPGEGEVRVAIRASGINPADVKRRSGWRATAPLSNRVIPHSDGAGVIDEVGPDIPGNWVGQRVWLWNAQGGMTYGTANGPETGTAAEFVVVPLRHAAPLPKRASFEVGACLGVPASTAHYAVFADGDIAGRTVLVQGGAGAVGELAIQFAAAAGAEVIATVSSPDKAKIARAAGAHYIIDRHEEDVVAAVRAIVKGGVDRIIEVDFGANAAMDAAMIAINGTIASYSSTSAPEPRLPYYPLQFRGATLRFIQGYLLPEAARAQAIAEIGARLEDEHLRPTIAASLPLEQIAAAHELVEIRSALGNVVVAME